MSSMFDYVDDDLWADTVGESFNEVLVPAFQDCSEKVKELEQVCGHIDTHGYSYDSYHASIDKLKV